MNFIETAINAAQASGELLMRNSSSDLAINEAKHHDIKLALDRESQELITSILLEQFPDHAIYGEEGLAGNQDSDYQWIVDPIDGTVNYFYGIPHFCISIALRHKKELIAGVILDPSMKELWTAEKGGPAYLNGKVISCSSRTQLKKSILAISSGKTVHSLDDSLARLKRASLRARKIRMMGSAALELAYIATGRLDAYVEPRLSLWDIAAGKLLVEAAGGKIELTAVEGDPDVWGIVATNGKIPIKEIL